MQISTFWLFIIAELFLALSIAVSILLYGRISQKRKDRKAAMHLVGFIKENDAKRQEEIESFLSSKFSLDGEKLGQARHGLSQAEKRLYQRIVNMYIKRDEVALKEMHIDVEGITESLYQLDAGASAAAGSSSAGSENGGDANSNALRAENDALKAELQITMETMSRMLSEYASMFGGTPQNLPDAPTMTQMLDEGDLPEADEIVADLEEDSFSSDEPLEELETLEDIDDLDIETPNGPDPVTEAPQDPDATVVSNDEFDLSDLAGDDADDFDILDDVAEEKTPMLDENGEEIDDDLADMWADAFEEEESDKSADKG